MPPFQMIQSIASFMSPPRQPALPFFAHDTSSCSESSTSLPVAIAFADSMAPVTLNDQQDPQEPWFFTGVTTPFARQSTLSGRSSRSCGTAAAAGPGPPALVRSPLRVAANSSRETSAKGPSSSCMPDSAPSALAVSSMKRLFSSHTDILRPCSSSVSYVLPCASFHAPKAASSASEGRPAATSIQEPSERGAPGPAFLAWIPVMRFVQSSTAISAATRCMVAVILARPPRSLSCVTKRWAWALIHPLGWVLMVDGDRSAVWLLAVAVCIATRRSW